MKRKKIFFIIFNLLIFLNFFAWLFVFDLSKNRFLKVVFFNLGQGEAIFIETPKRHQILIDGGPNSKILEKLGKEMPFWDRKIDLIILTHPEQDHLFGLLEVLKKYEIENILWTGVVRSLSEYNEWVQLIKKKRPRLFIAQAGQKIEIPGPVASSFFILHPFENLEARIFKDSNDTSVVAKFIYGQIHFLFTGDIYSSTEKELVRLKNFCSNWCQFLQLKSDILKVAHHGSKTSTCEEFLREVAPKIAVISVGKENRYGQPHPAVLDLLEKFGIKILRTDLDGEIKIISNGLNYAISTF